jgi:hypothetical protein
VVTGARLSAKAEKAIFAELRANRCNEKSVFRDRTNVTIAGLTSRCEETRLGFETSVPSAFEATGLSPWRRFNPKDDVPPKSRWADTCAAARVPVAHAEALTRLWRALIDALNSGATANPSIIRVLAYIKLREPAPTPLDESDVATIFNMFKTTSGQAGQPEVIRMFTAIPELESALRFDAVLDAVFGADFNAIEPKLREFLFAAVFVCWGEQLPEDALRVNPGFRAWLDRFGRLNQLRGAAAVEPFWALALKRGFAWAVDLALEHPIFLREGLTTPTLVLDLAQFDLSPKAQAIALCLARTANPNADKLAVLVARLSSLEWEPTAPEWEGALKGLKLRAEAASAPLLALLAERGLTPQ